MQSRDLIASDPLARSLFPTYPTPMPSGSRSFILSIVLHIFIYVVIFLWSWGDDFSDVAPAIVLGTLAIWISVIDFDRFRIPDLASLLLALTGLAFQFRFGLEALVPPIVAGLFWAAAFWMLSRGYASLRGWEGLGLGDVKLMFGIGIWLGLQATAVAVCLAAVGGISSILVREYLVRDKASSLLRSGIAFGPFLCLSCWVIWLAKGGF